MKRIYLSILAIVLTIGIVTGGAYALFSDEVTVSGLTVSTGNADLQISVDGSLYLEDFAQAYNITDLYPDYEDYGRFHLKNNSGSDIELRPSVRLTSAGGDWSTLKDVIEVKITEDGTNYSWGWQKLSWWNAQSRTITGATGISQNDTQGFRIDFRVLSSAGNSISDAELPNVAWEIIGEQVL